MFVDLTTFENSLKKFGKPENVNIKFSSQETSKNMATGKSVSWFVKPQKTWQENNGSLFNCLLSAFICLSFRNATNKQY